MHHFGVLPTQRVGVSDGGQIRRDSHAFDGWPNRPYAEPQLEDDKPFHILDDRETSQVGSCRPFDRPTVHLLDATTNPCGWDLQFSLKFA